MTTANTSSETAVVAVGNGISCPVCGMDIKDPRDGQIYCSDKCRNKAWRDEHREKAVAIAGTRRKARELSDGTIRVEIDIDPRYRRSFHDLLPEIDMPVALAPLEKDFEQKKPEPPTYPYSKQAEALFRAGFFLRPEVWRAVGTDEDFRYWVELQPSAWSGEFSEYVDDIGYCIAAHVRRVADGAGTALKPEYACIPLTDAEHKRQHQEGESAFGGKEWFDKQRIRYVSRWASEHLKQSLQIEHWNQSDPKILRQWAEQKGLERYLPEGYQ